MKKLYYYDITEADYEKGNYRPRGQEIDYIETEDGFNYGDVLDVMQNGYTAEIVEEMDDIIIWNETAWDPDNDVRKGLYFVEIKDLDLYFARRG